MINALTEHRLPSGYEKRKADASDTEFARRAHHSAYMDVVMMQFGSWDEKLQDALFETNWSQGKGYEILIRDGMPCGYYRAETLSDFIAAHELVLLPEFQGKGIGTHLLLQLIERAKALNVPVRLRVLKRNRAQELYQRMGFQKIGSDETHFDMEFRPNT